MKRIFDVIIAVLLLIIFLIPLLFIALLIKLTSKGPVLYWSDRIGKNNKIFKMPKFRTMRIDTPAVAGKVSERPETPRAYEPDRGQAGKLTG